MSRGNNKIGLMEGVIVNLIIWGLFIYVVGAVYYDVYREIAQ